MEYNVQRHSTGDLEEVVGELFLADQKSEKYYAGIVDYIKIDRGSFAAGIIIGSLSAILDSPKENVIYVLHSMAVGVTIPYVARFMEKAMGVEFPHARTFPVFAGMLLSEMLIKYLK